MSSRPTPTASARHARAARTLPSVPHVDAAEVREQRVLDQRSGFRLRHARGLADLMAQRDDLRGVHALADLVDDAVRWTV